MPSQLAEPSRAGALPQGSRVAAEEHRGLLARREWLLTDGLGGFAMGTIAGEPTRRYHGLLTVSLSPPVRRVAVLHSFNEIVHLHPDEARARTVDLTDLRFADGTVLTGGRDRLAQFELMPQGRNAGVWTFDLGGGARLVRTLELCERRGACVVTWSLGGARGWVRARPLLRLRDFHQLRHGGQDGLRVTHAADGRGLWISGGEVEAALTLGPQTAGSWHLAPHWWHGLRYSHETDRGFDDTDSLFCPGEVHAGLDQPAQVLTAVGLPGDGADLFGAEARSPQRVGRLRSALASVSSEAVSRQDHQDLGALVIAADQFVVRRGVSISSAREPGSAVSLIAGYPWFSDWGRDSMISLPGLLLATGRLEEAGRVLETFAQAQRDGLIPNRFADDGGEPEYNTADASLWFLHAVGEFVRAGGSDELVRDLLLPTCLDVIAGYTHGTRFHIGVDHADGLVRAGDERTQLTWMDAARDGVVFTPRQGKPVELQALWHHGLLEIADLLAPWDRATASVLRERAELAGRSLRARYWSDQLGCLADGLRPAEGGWAPVLELRPNQLLACSLARSALDQRTRAAVVRRCIDRLWTPGGVRTLDPGDANYHPRYAGPMRERDAAYHTGTAWPWLLGPMAEAVLRAGDFDTQACAAARALLRPTLDGLMPDRLSQTGALGLGQIAEVYDGDAHDQLPGGCPAQAWSVAELLRVMTLILRAEAARSV